MQAIERDAAHGDRLLRVRWMRSTSSPVSTIAINPSCALPAAECRHANADPGRNPHTHNLFRFAADVESIPGDAAWRVARYRPHGFDPYRIRSRWYDVGVDERHRGRRHANLRGPMIARARKSPNRRGDVLTCAPHVAHVVHMSKMIQIRHVPDVLHRRLRARAAVANMSLSDYLRQESSRPPRNASRRPSCGSAWRHWSRSPSGSGPARVARRASHCSR